MIVETSRGDRQARLATKLMWIPITVLVAGQLYLILFGNWLSLYVSFYSMGVGAVLALVSIVLGIVALIRKTDLKRHAILAITLPILTAALSLFSFSLFSG